MAVTLSEAQRLVNMLRSSIFMAEDTLSQIIEKRAWEVLGYSTFREFWEVEIADQIELTSLTRAVILYEMIDEANEELEHADQLLDTSTDFIEAIKEAHSRGMTRENAATHAELTVVREHTRRPRGKQHRVSVQNLEPSEIEYFKHMAKQLGIKTAELYTDGFRRGVNDLISEQLMEKSA